VIRIAVIHDWLTGMRGGEYVLEAITELFNPSDLFTLVYITGSASPELTKRKINLSWLQKFPGVEKRYRYYLPLMPAAIESFNLDDFDLIISSSHCVAKGIRKPKSAVHISYIHAPMRYIWDRYEDYFGPGKSSFAVRLAARLVRTNLQNWDKEASGPDRVDQLIANSHFIAGQIKKAYNRDSQVIYPFANLNRFKTLSRRPGATYLMVGAFAPYKRTDLAIEAFNQLKLPLQIVGAGQDEDKLRRLAGSTIQFLGQVSNETIAELYSKCRAFVFPGVEDFGITPLEAMAAGAPIIALMQGGGAETVTPETGVFFKTQTVEALVEAIETMEAKHPTFLETTCRQRASEFSKMRFQSELLAAVQSAWNSAGKDPSLLDHLQLKRSQI
jgi:glycosyltransferase involved in cell wall biosynthesis